MLMISLTLPQDQGSVYINAESIQHFNAQQENGVTRVYFAGSVLRVLETSQEILSKIVGAKV